MILDGPWKEGSGGIAWIGLAQDKEQWRAIVNAVKNLRVL
jgi:hypothetical protein